MTLLATTSRPWRWLFESAPKPVSSWRVVAWWEVRRLPFNLIIGTYAVACLILFEAAIHATGVLKPGEDAEEPIALLAAPILVNVLYTLGWLVEIPIRILMPNLSTRFGPWLLK